jgi:hypothetical protein
MSIAYMSCPAEKSLCASIYCKESISFPLSLGHGFGFFFGNTSKIKIVISSI